MSEIDSSEAFGKLLEANALPLFLGTSSMVMLTPVFYVSTDDTSANRIQILERSLNVFMDLSKKNTQVIIKRFGNTGSSPTDRRNLFKTCGPC